MRTRHVRHFSGQGIIFKVLTARSKRHNLADACSFQRNEYAIEDPTSKNKDFHCVPKSEYRACSPIGRFASSKDDKPVVTFLEP